MFFFTFVITCNCLLSVLQELYHKTMVVYPLVILQQLFGVVLGLGNGGGGDAAVTVQFCMHVQTSYTVIKVHVQCTQYTYVL